MEVKKDQPTQGKRSYYEFFNIPVHVNRNLKQASIFSIFLEGKQEVFVYPLAKEGNKKKSNEFTIRNLCTGHEAIIMKEKIQIIK